ncbi:ABC transporter ATP-binding protein [Sporichthya brevicatena]|uniref:ABC transporter ATP-binding protein n=1 Tax=Sporichthya brevicatena TaxID=171442 RepID=A0ABN1GSU9_9ACTN
MENQDDAVGNDSRSVLRGALGRQRRWVGAAGALFICHQAGEALVPVLIGVIIDEAVATGDGSRLLAWLGALAAVFAFLSFGYRLGARCAERASEQAAHDLRLRLAERVLDDRGGAEAGRLPGALAGLATSDTAKVGILAFALPSGIAALAGLLVGGAALLRLSVPLGLVVLLGAPPMLWLVNLLGKPLEARSAEQQERAAASFGVAADLVAGLRVLKGVGAEPAAVARYRRVSQDSLQATLRAARADAAYEAAMIAMTGLFLAGVALLGGYLATQDHITVGELVAAVGLAQFLIGPMQAMAWVGSELAAARASSRRIAEVLSSPPAIAGGTAVPVRPVRGDVELRGVRSGSLAGLDLTVSSGEFVGVAADPADARALLRCLARETDPDGGAVLLDGRPLTELDPGPLRRTLLVAAHDAHLFEGSLLDNVLDGRGDDAPREPAAVRAALTAGGADEVAAALPEGVATTVGERGRGLSGGQRQRVALARALAADSPVLVLHDPTTAVDAATEARLAAGIRDLRQGRTTVLLTTSPALLAVTDRVALVRAGRVDEVGTHADLVARSAGYRELVLR